MDEIDQANEVAQMFLNNSLEKVREGLNQITAGGGICLNCDEKLDEGERFCDRHCRDDFQERQRADKRNAKYRG